MLAVTFAVLGFVSINFLSLSGFAEFNKVTIGRVCQTVLFDIYIYGAFLLMSEIRHRSFLVIAAVIGAYATVVALMFLCMWFSRTEFWSDTKRVIKDVGSVIGTYLTQFCARFTFHRPEWWDKPVFHKTEA